MSADNQMNGVLHLWQELHAQSKWVQGVGLGYIPEGPTDPGANEPSLVVFMGAAPECEQQPIRDAANQAGGQVVLSSAFVGLSTTGGAVGVSSSLRPDVLPVAGTLGAVARTASKDYVLGSNHTIAFNGRAPAGSLILDPGPVDDASGGQVIATLSSYIEMHPGPGTLNAVDCAWGEVVGNWSAGLPAVTEAAPAYRDAVHKTGRTSGRTTSKIWFPVFAGLIDFTFGTYEFAGLSAAYNRVPDLPFAMSGDSGSAVRRDSGGELIGFVVARGYTYDSNSGLVNGAVILLCTIGSVRVALAPQLPGLAGFAADV